MTNLANTTVLIISIDRVEKLNIPLDEAEMNNIYIEFDRNKNIVIDYMTILSSIIFTIWAEKPDILIVNGASLVGLITIVIGKLFNKGVIIRVGGDPWKTTRQIAQSYLRDYQLIMYVKKKISLYLTSIVLNLAIYVIVVSDEVEDKISRIKPKIDTFVIPPPIDEKKISSSSEKLNCQNEVNLLTVTDLSWDGKLLGTLQALDGIAKISETDKIINYKIASEECRNEEKIKSRIQKIRKKTNHNIEYLGYVSDVRSLYKSSSIFIYISHIDGYPNAVTEALANGLPVVTNNDHGMSEQVSDGINGFFVDPEDPGDIANRTAEIYNNPLKMKDMSEKSVDMIYDKNSPTLLAKDYERMVAHILAD